MECKKHRKLKEILKPFDMTYVVGDLNGDGVIDQKDLDLLSQYIAGNKVPESTIIQAGDINGDGRIDESDYTILARYIRMKKTIADAPYMNPALYAIGIQEEGSISLKKGDVDNSGTVNYGDYRDIEDYLNNRKPINLIASYILPRTGVIDTLTEKPSADDLSALIEYLRGGENPNNIGNESLYRCTYVLGDVNNDGIVDNNDLIMLNNYNATGSVIINELAADINGEHDFRKSATILRYYIWDQTGYFDRIGKEVTGTAKYSLFYFLREQGAPWMPSADDILNFHYLLNHSGEKYASPLLEYFSEEQITLTALSTVAQIIMKSFKDKWNRMSQYQNVSYDPIDNYNRYSEITETDTGERADTHTESGSDVTGTTVTGTAQANRTGNVYGFNSTNSVPANTETGTNTTTDTTEGSVTHNNNLNIKSNDSRNKSYSEHTHGNIGVTTTAQMLQGDSEFWSNWDFINQVFKDIDSVLALKIYN